MTLKVCNFQRLSLEEKKLVLEWRNYPLVSINMVNQKVISWEEHCKFIENLTDDKTREYLLLYKKDVPVAVFYVVDIIEYTSAEWGFYLRPEYIGSGLGVEVEFYALNYLFSKYKLEKLNAVIRKSNYENLNLQKTFRFERYKEDENFDYLTMTRDSWSKNTKDFKQFRRELLRRISNERS